MDPGRASISGAVLHPVQTGVYAGGVWLPGLRVWMERFEIRCKPDFAQLVHWCESC